MAKTSKIQKEYQRQRTVKRYSDRRHALKQELRKAWHDGDAKTIMTLQSKLNKMPRDANPCRLRTRCRKTGRPNGVYRLVGFGRAEINRLILFGLLPGFAIASW